ncbi:hypothetical protein BDP27DRAFT_599403 [Rhodocollybia butyracea]|uniref:Uncharacterized protein n=1 Tax=Rhodocollybia butyracea TaxID=206335 RepID=A0A9P5UG77_9AGAR|nr:hypothetical protein BDP27DRAFT_599403 [Rhodocollybia butyracea]
MRGIDVEHELEHSSQSKLLFFIPIWLLLKLPGLKLDVDAARRMIQHSLGPSYPRLPKIVPQSPPDKMKMVQLILDVCEGQLELQKLHKSLMRSEPGELLDDDDKNRQEAQEAIRIQLEQQSKLHNALTNKLKMTLAMTPLLSPDLSWPVMDQKLVLLKELTPNVTNSLEELKSQEHDLAEHESQKEKDHFSLSDFQVQLGEIEDQIEAALNRPNTFKVQNLNNDSLYYQFLAQQTSQLTMSALDTESQLSSLVTQLDNLTQSGNAILHLQVEKMVADKISNIPVFKQLKNQEALQGLQGLVHNTRVIYNRLNS